MFNLKLIHFLKWSHALILKGNFVANKNYYEDFVDSYSWWPTH